MSGKVSVIVAVRNGENYLAEAIESIIQQDYENTEVIVVNDGSTDQTGQIMEQFGTTIRAFHQEHKGLGAGRNRGIQEARGDYLAFLDHDDLWTKTKISAQMKEMVLYRDPLVFSQMQQFICPSLTEEERKKLSVNCSVVPGYFAGTLLISKKRFCEIGYFVEKIGVGDFVEWFGRAKALQLPMLVLPEVTLYRRVHLENMGRRHDLYKRENYLVHLKAGLDRRRAMV